MLLSVAVEVVTLASILTLVMALAMAKHFRVVTVEPVVTVTLTLKLFLEPITLQSVVAELLESMAVQVQPLELQQLVLV
jgi:hypothetical protein